MNYAGSKHKLLEQLLPNFDYTKKTFVDLFCGSFVVGTNVVDKYDKVIANDIITDLIGIHKSLLESDDIVNEVKSISPGKGNPVGYADLRNSYNEDKSPVKLWALMLSCQNNLMRFNNSFKFNQTYGERGYNDSTQKKVESWTSYIRPFYDKIEFNSLRFDDLYIPTDSMVYIDPPYGFVDIDGQIGRKQISEAGYNCYWKQQDDLKLYEFCKELDKSGQSFMLSGVWEHGGQTCWIINKLISDGFKYKILDFDYEKVSRKKDNKNTKEVIIFNY